MLKIRNINNITVINFDSDIKRLNVTISSKVKEQLLEIINKPNSKLILDFNGISFIDSSGFGALVNIYNKAKENNSYFKLCNISQETMELVFVTKLDKVFEIHDTLDGCLNSF
ncbi:MAG: STAS domain-containing protein [Bacteroidales bacterium]|nr:STAS domain-containing protein [Bacteroidales bacterium]